MGFLVPLGGHCMLLPARLMDVGYGATCTQVTLPTLSPLRSNWSVMINSCAFRMPYPGGQTFQSGKVRAASGPWSSCNKFGSLEGEQSELPYVDV